jgi:hypothetical protein
VAMTLIFPRFSNQLHVSDQLLHYYTMYPNHDLMRCTQHRLAMKPRLEASARPCDDETSAANLIKATISSPLWISRNGLAQCDLIDVVSWTQAPVRRRALP